MLLVSLVGHDNLVINASPHTSNFSTLMGGVLSDSRIQKGYKNVNRGGDECLVQPGSLSARQTESMAPATPSIVLANSNSKVVPTLRACS